MNEKAHFLRKDEKAMLCGRHGSEWINRIVDATIDELCPECLALLCKYTNERAKEYEKACREWLKGCSCAQKNSPEDCSECTKAFLDHIKKLGGND